MKRAIIIGATSGIGKEVARILAEKGWKVGIAGRREALLKQMKESDPKSFEYEVLDVTREDAPERLESLISKTGGMDLYLHSSGHGMINPDLDPEQQMTTVETNITGFVRLINFAFHYFRNQKHGHIAAITSVAGTRGMGINAAYSASKRFQMTYLTALAQLSENRKYNIRITEIRPGFVRTEFLHRKYPMCMEAPYVAEMIVRGLLKGKRHMIIDWRYRLLIFAWKMIPERIWEKINLYKMIRK
ncbi:MAG: SDR family NAD(P)-dependent oxidoreductase [Bacteroidales bacterium]|jgi:short-subunit dehydrogenase